MWVDGVCIQHYDPENPAQGTQKRQIHLGRLKFAVLLYSTPVSHDEGDVARHC